MNYHLQLINHMLSPNQWAPPNWVTPYKNNQYPFFTNGNSLPLGLFTLTYPRWSSVAKPILHLRVIILYFQYKSIRVAKQSRKCLGRENHSSLANLLSEWFSLVGASYHTSYQTLRRITQDSGDLHMLDNFFGSVPLKLVHTRARNLSSRIFIN